MTLQAAIQLYDGMTGPLRTMHSVLSTVVESFQSMQEISQDAIDVRSIEAARQDLQGVGAAVTAIEEGIEQANKRQQELNQSFQNGVSGADTLGGKIKRLAGAYAGMAGLRMGKNWVQDALGEANSQMNAEIQLRTVLSNTQTVEDLMQPMAQQGGLAVPVNLQMNAPEVSPAAQAFDQIAAEAAKYEYYGSGAMTAGAAELASYIQDADAITRMMGTLADYSMGMSGGGDLTNQQIVEYATQLGKALDGTYDGLKKKGFDLTDLQKEIIESGTDMQKAMVLEDVIGQSWAGLYDNMSNTPEGQIRKLTNSFSDLKGEVGQGLYPHVLRFVDTIRSNMPQITQLVHSFGNTAGKVVVVLSGIAGAALAVASAFQNNWGIIGPVIGGIAGVMGAYNAVLLANNIAMGISNGLKALAAVRAVAHGTAELAAAAATAGMTTAQMSLNAAIWACPLTWIVVAIIAVIAVFYAAVAAVNKFADTSYSATGIICGLFAVMAGNIFNQVLVPLQHGWSAIANFIGNVFRNPVGSIEILFYDMAQTVLGYILNMARAIEALINKIPGVTKDITSGLSRLYDGFSDATQKLKDENEWTEFVQKVDYVDYGTAYDSGYNFGSGLEDKVKGIFNSGSLDLGEQEYRDNTSAMADELAGIGGDTGAIRDSVEVTSEDLKYLRDLAEREVINRFTTAEIKVDMVNHNSINNVQDRDGFISSIADQLEEALLVAVERAPAY